ncbi:hypothetical protein E2C01_053691 [Portunus trituberculatus]|uniref:Uncharacterized protein n=1 Tax=Portunus trituberculatus TaxID=210409 RepID=A0A5B7GRI1_PORTR|nr:hypothetical protein [Portunus trituberculatus]
MLTATRDSIKAVLGASRTVLKAARSTVRTCRHCERRPIHVETTHSMAGVSGDPSSVPSNTTPPLRIHLDGGSSETGENR